MSGGASGPERRFIRWEGGGCRDRVYPGGPRYEATCPGKRACHFSEVGHCLCAYGEISGGELARGPVFRMQLVGNEPLYKVLAFVNGEQRRLQQVGKTQYIKELEEAQN